MKSALHRLTRRMALAVLLCICLCCTGCMYGAGQKLRAETKENISSYLTENRDALLGEAENILGWSDAYYLLHRDGDRIFGHRVEWPYAWEEVRNDKILAFFAENNLIAEIAYPVNSGIIQFYVNGFGMVSASTNIGFYYAPKDMPAWIDSEQLVIYSMKTGRYMDYPLLPQGDGWIADTSVLDFADENDSFLEDYALYTERLCENFFYYESSY